MFGRESAEGAALANRVFQVLEVVTPDRVKKSNSVTIPPSGVAADLCHLESAKSFFTPSEYLDEMTSLASLVRESG